jgi:hypothetical protein
MIDTASSLLPHSREWDEGFEVGLVYALMAMDCVVIEGKYYNVNDEQLHVMAQQMGYDVEWSRVDDTRVQMRFVSANSCSHGEMDADEDEDSASSEDFSHG